MTAASVPGATLRLTFSIATTAVTMVRFTSGRNLWDATANAWKVWAFTILGPPILFANGYWELQRDWSNIMLSKSFAWTLDAMGNWYVGRVTTT